MRNGSAEIIPSSTACRRIPRKLPRSLLIVWADTFPRRYWRTEVERGYRFFEQSGASLHAPPIEAVVRYYEERAPEELPHAELKAATRPLPVKFEPVSYPPPPRFGKVAISHLELVRLSRPGAKTGPLDILAWQYDIVCNGVELSSGAIRNHRPDIMYKAFEIAGYSREEVDTGFPGMIGAFKFGAPPHGGSAPGIDRIVMLLADEPNIREVIVFPMNQRAEDLMMNAPAPVMDKQLKELSIRIVADGTPKAS